jgi:endonuclease/exonuclease/phosphatase family metal-dependent hydrolase
MLIRGDHPDDRTNRVWGNLGSGTTVLSIANFNMHCGIDGWGRPYDYAASITSLGTDVIVLEEVWTHEGASDSQAEEVAHLLGLQVVSHQLGEGRRIRPQPDATDSWMPRPVTAKQNWPLLFDGVRPLSKEILESSRWREGEPGRTGVAVLVRPDFPIQATRVLPMSALRADRVRRAALVIDLVVEGRPISVAGTHMAHLHAGSHRNWAELRRALHTDACADTVLAGDMNTWGPLVHVFLPGWRRAVVGPTWPTWRPHSQIDHILVRGALRAVTGEVLPPAGSDHRPVRARLTLD